MTFGQAKILLTTSIVENWEMQTPDKTDNDQVKENKWNSFPKNLSWTEFITILVSVWLNVQTESSPLETPGAVAVNSIA